MTEIITNPTSLTDTSLNIKAPRYQIKPKSFRFRKSIIFVFHSEILVFMPTRGDDDDDILLSQDGTTRSTTSTEEETDDVIGSYTSKEDPGDQDSTGGGSASGGSVTNSMSDILNGDHSDGVSSVQNDMLDFTSYTQKSSFMLENGGMAPTDGRVVVNLDGFFDAQKNGGYDDDLPPGEKSIFKSNVSKLSFMRPQHWGYASSETSSTPGPSTTIPNDKDNALVLEQEERGGRRSSEGNTGTFTKSRNAKMSSKHAKKILNKQSSVENHHQPQQPPKKDIGPKKRLRRLSAVPSDTYALSAQQVLDLLKLLDLSDFAPMFAFDRIDGRVLSKLNLDELMRKYGMSEEQSMQLLAQINQQDIGKEDDKSITSYQTTNGALEADYNHQQKTSQSHNNRGSWTNRYF